MKRKDFFKRFGFGVAAAIVAPKLIVEVIEETKVKKGWELLNDPNLLSKDDIDKGNRNYLSIQKDIWKHTGKSITPGDKPFLDVLAKDNNIELSKRLRNTFGDQSLQDFCRSIGSNKI